MTIYDIAKEAGVSASTVSRVINKQKGVNQATREKVESLLEKYRFEPDASARGLVQQSTKIIGVIISDIRYAHHAAETYFIEKELNAAGYNCIIVNSGFSTEDRQRAIRAVTSRRVEAVVLIGSTFQTRGVRTAIEAHLANIPVIIENGYLDLPNVYGLIADEKTGVSDCTRLICEQGRKHPVYITLGKTPSNTAKIQGYRSVCRRFFPQQDPFVLELVENPGEGEDEWQISYNATLQLMSDHPETDALIYSTDLLANAGCRALNQLGIGIPEQCAIIGIDNSLYSRITSPPLTTLDNKMQELSIMCSDILIDLLNGKKAAHKMVLSTDIIEREST